MLRSRPFYKADFPNLVWGLREADKAELHAASGLSVPLALRRSIEATAEPMVGVNEVNRPVCIGGVVPFGDGMRGAVWAVATTEVDRHRVSFLRRSIPWVHHWQAQYPILTNCVDERNTVHIEWLRWLGFIFINRHPTYGHERRPFLEFVRINPIV